MCKNVFETVLCAFAADRSVFYCIALAARTKICLECILLFNDVRIISPGIIIYFGILQKAVVGAGLVWYNIPGEKISF